jgi:hypothetical protein
MSDLYCFGSFEQDSRRNKLSRGDSRVFLTPKAFDVLLFPVQNPNRLVTKGELAQAMWGEVRGRGEPDTTHLASTQGPRERVGTALKCSYCLAVPESLTHVSLPHTPDGTGLSSTVSSGTLNVCATVSRMVAASVL